MRRVAFAAAGVLGMATLGGCTVGGGHGKAIGSLYVIGCNNGKNYGDTDGGALTPAPYSLQPVFFAGVPIEDLMQGPAPSQMNQISLRMQSTGLSIMYNDTLYFDVINSYEVARCLRGRTVNGQPDWKVTEPLPTISLLTPLAGSSPPATLWCDWSGTAFTDGGAPDAAAVDAGTPDAGTTGAALDGGVSMMAQYPRIRITPYTDLHSSIGLLATCPTADLSAVALDGWIQFQNFGSAEQPDKAPEDRDPVPANFVINYGERLQANFHIVLADQAVVYAVSNNLPQPDPLIGGELDGSFDFDLQRGRSAQPFP